VATLNRIAPGRIFLGIGTGNTALRSMGQRPMRIARVRRLSQGAGGPPARRDRRLRA